MYCGRPELLHVLGDRVDLLVVDVGALDAHGERVPRRGEEHVALAEELLGAHGVDDDPGVELVGHHEGDAGRDVGLDEAGDHVDGGPLRGEHHVDAHGARHGGEPRQGGLQLLARGGHEVGELVDDDDDVGQALDPLLLRLLVEGADVAHAQGVQERVAPLHLRDAVLQRLEGLLRVRDHGGEQVGAAVVELQLDDLRIDEEKPHLVGAPPEEDGADDRVDQNALARVGGPADEQVRRLHEVDDLRLPEDVLAEGEGDLVRPTSASRPARSSP